MAREDGGSLVPLSASAVRPAADRGIDAAGYQGSAAGLREGVLSSIGWVERRALRSPASIASTYEGVRTPEPIAEALARIVRNFARGR